MIYNFEGTIKEMFDTVTFDSGFSKREIVLTSDEQYPQEVKFEFIKETIASLDAFAVGESAKIAFAVRGNEYNGKHFVNLQMWYVESLDIAEGNPNQEMPTQAAKLIEESADDLPF